MTRISELDKLTTNVQFKEKEKECQNLSQLLIPSWEFFFFFNICFSLLGKYHL